MHPFPIHTHTYVCVSHFYLGLGLVQAIALDSLCHLFSNADFIQAFCSLLLAAHSRCILTVLPYLVFFLDVRKALCHAQVFANYISFLGEHTVCYNCSCCLDQSQNKMLDSRKKKSRSCVHVDAFARELHISLGTCILYAE